MGAAPQIPPASQEAKKLISILSSQSVKFPSGSEKAFLSATEFEATRFASLEMILNSPSLEKPGVVILEVADEGDIAQAHGFLKAYEGAIAHSRLKAIVLTNIRHEDIRGKFKNFNVADFLLFPMPDRTFLFKVDLQFKIIGNQLETDDLKQDPNFDLHSAQKKRNGRFALKVIGPSPTRGAWQMVNQSPTGAVRWRWVKKPTPSPEEQERDAKKGEWTYEGDKEPEWKSEEKLWEMEANDPLLEKQAQGKKLFSSREKGWTGAHVPKALHESQTKSPLSSDAGSLGGILDRTTLSDEPLSPGAKNQPSPLSAQKEVARSPKNTNGETTESPPSAATASTPKKENPFRPEAISTPDPILPSRSEPLPKTAPPNDSPTGDSVPVSPSSETDAKNQKNVGATDRPAEPALNNRVGPRYDPIPVPSRPREAHADSNSSPSDDKNEKQPSAAPHKNRTEEAATPSGADFSDQRKNEECVSVPDGEGALYNLKDRPESASLKQKLASAPVDFDTKKTTKAGDATTPETKNEESPPLGTTSEETTSAPLPGSQSQPEEKNVKNGGAPSEEIARSKKSSEQEDSIAWTMAKKRRPNQGADDEDLPRSSDPDPASNATHQISPDSNKSRELRERQSPPTHSRGEEIRVRAPLESGPVQDKNLYKVVQERIHFFKTLEELRDDSSSWERVEAYRVYIPASKKYYGVKSIHELLPIWIYVGEQAPEFIEERKSWLFWDRIPVEYRSIEEIPPPVLNYFLDLRNRDVMRRIEETKIRGHSEEEKTIIRNEEKNENKAEAAAIAPNASATNSSPQDGLKVGEVEHVKKDSLAEKVAGFFSKLFS